jgi:hypothetical protein
MELDIGSVQPEEVRTYLYICTLLQRLCRPSIYIMLTPLGIVGSFPTDRQRPNVVTRQCGGQQQAGMCQRGANGIARSPASNRTDNCANARRLQEVLEKDDSGCSRFRLNCEALRSFANGIQIYEYMPHVCL